MINQENTFLLRTLRTSRLTDYTTLSKKVIISWDVKFDEAKFWQWDAPNVDQNPLLVDMDDKEDARDLELEETQPLTSPFSSHSTSDKKLLQGREEISFKK